MAKIVESISIENYKGFSKTQIVNFADINSICFLIGQNNSGKSLIARAIRFLHKPSGQKSEIILTDNDFHNAIVDNPIKIQFEILSDILKQSANPDLLKISNLKKVVLQLEIVKEQSKFYCYSSLFDGLYKSHTLTKSDEAVNYKCHYNDIFGTNYDLQKADIEKSCDALSEYLKEIFLVFAPIRTFNSSSTNIFNTTGTEVVSWIKENKEIGLIKDAKMKVANYLKRLNLDSPLDISVEKDADYLTFTFDNYLKLTSNDVGTGYTMIYILLIEIIRSKKKIIIIDEIESHLQPGLIRELIKIIREIGNEQFIIATHSPTVIESARENDYLYRFQKNDGSCVISKFYKNRTDAKLLRSVCNDLGIIPGDALLSNCVIWVEGPSEIFWLRAWMRAYSDIYRNQHSIKSNIMEGLHYSILMTGGGLIAHISYDEECINIEDIEEEYKLKVLRVNPNPFVIIDSDNSDPHSAKYKRCYRIAEEINNQNALNNNNIAISGTINENNIEDIPNLWLLKGRELENYCHPQLLKDFYTKIARHGNSIIKDIEKVSNWDVYSKTEGVGKILAKQGLEGVNETSGTIKHKSGLAQYIFNEFSSKHFDVNPINMEQPNNDMISELKIKLESLFKYLIEINSLN